MTARVLFNASTPMGQLAAEAVDAILEGKAKLGRLNEALYAMVYPSDPAAIEAELGLEAGKGQQFFDLIAGAKTALDAQAIVALREISPAPLPDLLVGFLVDQGGHAESS